MSKNPTLETLAKRLERQETTVKKKLAELCHKYPSIKGDYRLMTYRFWTEVCGIKITFKDFNTIRRAPSPETIGRRFRELQASDPISYQPSLATIDKRQHNERLYRTYFKTERTVPLLLWL
jgi:hypothetical protein